MAQNRQRTGVVFWMESDDSPTTCLAQRGADDNWGGKRYYPDLNLKKRPFQGILMLCHTQAAWTSGTVGPKRSTEGIARPSGLTLPGRDASSPCPLTARIPEGRFRQNGRNHRHFCRWTCAKIASQTAHSTNRPGWFFIGSLVPCQAQRASIETERKCGCYPNEPILEGFLN